MRRRRNFKVLCDASLVFAARMLVDSKGIKRRGWLRDEHPGIYDQIRRRGLMDEIGIDNVNKEHRDWAGLKDDEIAQQAIQLIRQEGITMRSQMEIVDRRLYKALVKRNLMDRVGLGKSFIDWASMSDEDLIGYARAYIKENGLAYRTELARSNPRLYDTMGRRGLRGALGLEFRFIEWSSMSDDEMVAFAAGFMKEEDVTSRIGLRKRHLRLYNALCRRGLLDSIEFEGGSRAWRDMSDEELVGYTERYVKRKGISCKSALAIADKGLYGTLLRRDVMESIAFSQSRGSWSTMSDQELVECARGFVAEERIDGRHALRKAYSGLYQALLRRRLLDEVGFVPKKRQWNAMQDHELVGYAKRFIDGLGISCRGEFYRVDSGLFQALRRRGLLDAVFHEIDRTTDAVGIKEVVEGLKEFGDSG